MTTLAQLRSLSGHARFAALPEPLRMLFTRHQRARRMGGLIFGALMAAIGIAGIVFEYDPPLSAEEIGFVMLGVLAVLIGLYGVVYTFAGPDPGMWGLVDEDVVWAFTRFKRRTNQYLVLATDTGVQVEVRMDEDGRPFALQEEQTIYAAVRALHPQAQLGYSRELEAQWKRSPSSLRSIGTARSRSPLHMLFDYRGVIVVVGAIAAFCAVWPISSAIWRFQWDQAHSNVEANAEAMPVAPALQPVAAPPPAPVTASVSGVSIDGTHFTMTVVTAPGAQVTLSNTFGATADETGIASFDLATTMFWNEPPTTRELPLAVRVGGALVVEQLITLPRTLGEARALAVHEEAPSPSAETPRPGARRVARPARAQAPAEDPL